MATKTTIRPPARSAIAALSLYHGGAVRMTSSAGAGTLRGLVVGLVATVGSLRRGELPVWSGAVVLAGIGEHMHAVYWDMRTMLLICFFWTNRDRETSSSSSS